MWTDVKNQKYIFAYFGSFLSSEMKTVEIQTRNAIRMCESICHIHSLWIHAHYGKNLCSLCDEYSLWDRYSLWNRYSLLYRYSSWYRYSFYHTRPCAYQWFQGCECKVCETHGLKVKWQKRIGERSTAIVIQLCLSQCMTSQWCNHKDHCRKHRDHFITIGHQQLTDCSIKFHQSTWYKMQN